MGGIGLGDSLQTNGFHRCLFLDSSAFSRYHGGKEVLALLYHDQFILRPADVSFSPALAAFYEKNREFFAPFNPSRTEEFYTEAYQKQVLEQEVLAWEQRTSFRFYLFDRENPQVILGTIGLNNVVWGGFRSCFLGYKLDRDHINRGYMTAAVNLVTAYAFEELGLHRIEGNVMPRNLASRRVLEKCGYENEGLSRAYLQINGIWEDHIHMVKRNTAMETP